MKRNLWMLLTVSTLLSVVIVGYFVASSKSAKRLEAARAKLVRPQSLLMYMALQTGVVAESSEVSGGDDLDRWRQQIQAFDDLFRDTEFLEEDRDWNKLSEWIGQPESEWPERRRQTFRRFIDSIQPVLERIRTIADRGGPIRTVEFSSDGVDIEPYAPMRNFARLLYADATAAAAKGDMGRIADNIIATMQLGDALAEEPILLSQLVRFAIYGLARSQLELLDVQTLSDPHYDRLMDALAESDRREEFAACFGGEGARSEAFFQSCDSFGIDDWGGLFEGALMELYTSPIGRPLMNLDASTSFEIFAQMQEIARRPLYEAQAEAVAIDERIENLSRLRVFSRYITSPTASLALQARHEAVLDIAQIGLSVERYQCDTGNYPQSLDEIAAFLPGNSVPVDPFTGSLYIYEPMESSFRLYSVGLNQADDLGRVGQSLSTGDIVWRGVEEGTP